MIKNMDSKRLSLATASILGQAPRKSIESLSQLIDQAWYRGSWWLNFALPAAWLFEAVARRRRSVYQAKPDKQWKPQLPVIVVGNISVGGTGKTPLVIAIAQQLKQQGYHPGIVSRGYGAQASVFPKEVFASTSAGEGGDEPVLIAKRSACPVVIDPDRVAAVQHLLSLHHCDVIISDDGLQHYALGRDIEIVAIDGQRGLGNHRCLPAGPLRESPSRLAEVDFVVINGDRQAEDSEPGAEEPSASKKDPSAVKKQPSALKKESSASMVYGPHQYKMVLRPGQIQALNAAQEAAQPDSQSQQAIHGVAGIGNPQRFFRTLRAQGYQLIEHRFPDHYCYKQGDFDFELPLAIVMTEKDAVKCQSLNLPNSWYLPVDAQLGNEFWQQLFDQLRIIKNEL